MASIIAWLIGLLFFGLGCWILLLRFEGLVDRIWPHNMSIGQITVDGKESKGYAELLRARFDYHFRRPVALRKETGFLEVAALDAPALFQPKGLGPALEKMTVEVSGVDVAKWVRLVNQLARPDQWVVEGDFQTQSDRALLALRLSRGPRLIRTWYLERPAEPAADKSVLLERLIDDAIFQLVYDFGNEAETDADLRKWRRLLPPPTAFPNRAALAAYYEARGALGRYYAYGGWRDLDLALDRLRALRGQMPEYADGLQLLGMALTEKRNHTEAIHVFEQLRLLLFSGETEYTALSASEKRRLLSVDLLKATATANLDTWQATHQAVAELLQLADRLKTEPVADLPPDEQAAYGELQAQTAVQLAHTYALYLSFLGRHTVAEVFGSPAAPAAWRVNDPAELEALKSGTADQAKRIVRRLLGEIADEHTQWIGAARQQQARLEGHWQKLADGSRRRAELVSRLNLAAGYAGYRMAEFESHDAARSDTVFGETFAARLDEAAQELTRADASHPNHYQVLQLLGLVYSEPRRPGMMSQAVAEQYFERAVGANPADSYGHELLASMLFRRLADMGVDPASRASMEKGLAEAQAAIALRETSGSAHLLRARFQTLLLEIERDDGRRRELRAGLERSLAQAERFLPRAFGRPDPDLTFLRAVAASRRLGEAAEEISLAAEGNDLARKKEERFAGEQEKVLTLLDELLADCEKIEERWVAQQRVYQVRELKERARRLRHQIERASLANWREVRIDFR